MLNIRWNEKAARGQLQKRSVTEVHGSRAAAVKVGGGGGVCDGGKGLCFALRAEWNRYRVCRPAVGVGRWMSAVRGEIGEQGGTARWHRTGTVQSVAREKSK